MITLITEDDDSVALVGEASAETLLVDAVEFAAATGWLLKPEGLCRGDVCIPRSLWPDMEAHGRIDLSLFAAAVSQPVVVDPASAIVAIGTSAITRHRALESLDAPQFTADGLDGEPIALSDYAGRKKVIVTFASWCGCRHDLPGWQELHEELEPKGLRLIAVAVDEEVDDARPWVEEANATFPVVLDRDHVVCEAFDIRNVPTVVWIDENDRIVRPNDVAFGTDIFKEFHGVDSSPHHEALRRWVIDDELPMTGEEVHQHQIFPTDDEQLARLHFRVALELRRRDDPGAARHFERAGELAPNDFTVRRAAMPLQGIDPFLSEEFIALWEEYKERGGYNENYGFEHAPPPT